MAHPHPHIVKTTFVDVDNNVVYPGLTATLKDMRTKIRITLRQPPSDASHLQSAMASIALRDGSNKAKSYELSLGQNDITHSSVEGDMKYPFEINKTYSVRITVELSNKDTNESSMYVGEFTYGDKENESSYDQFIYRDPENLDEFSNDSTKFKLVDHEFFEKDGTIKIDCPIDFNEAVDARKPVNVTFVFDEVDDYPGTTNDTPNTEHKKAYIKLPYQDDGHYEFLESDLKGALENDHAYHILVTAYYSDGHTINKTLDDNAHFIVNPVIIVEPYGLGDDGTGAGDVNDSAALVLHVQKDTIGLESSNIPVGSDNFTLKLSQGGVDMYTGQLNTSDGVTTTRTVDGEEKEFLTYTVPNRDLNKVGTPEPEDDGTHNFDAQVFATYSTLPGTSTPTLEKPSNVVPGTYAHDYTPITQVDIANAWMAATNVVYSGDREVNMADPTTTNGYTIAPNIGIVGSFFKTADFGSGVTDGLLKDLDVDSTKFKYEISVTNDDEADNWQPVKKIHQIQGAVGGMLQENYIAVMTAPEQSNDDGEYANIPYTGTAGTSGPAQPRIYFRICETVSSDVVFSEDQIVKVRVTIVPEDKSTNVGSKDSEMCVVVKKITRYSMTPDTVSEPMFIGSGNDGTLLIPINAEEEEGSADTHFVSAQFQSNLDAPNADITQTDADDADQGEGENEDDDDDHRFNLVVINPNKRGVGANNAITYTVTYKINDPNGGTVKIKSADYSINVIDDPTSANFAITNYNYNTFNDDGESSFTFNVSFSDGATTGIDGVNVYFSSTNDDDDASNNIPRLLVKNVPRKDGHSQLNLPVMLTNTPAQNSSATTGITVNDIDGNESTTWLNYRSGTISFAPYKTIRVFGNIIDGDEEPLIEKSPSSPRAILNIPVIDMPENVLLVSGVVESHKGTQLTWSDDSWDYSNTSVTPSYDLVDNGANVSNNVVADSDDDSKRSYLVDTDSNPAPYSFKFDLRTKLTSNYDSTVYYSKIVTVEFTSASVDLSDATAVAKRGSNESTLKALLNGYETTDASDIAGPTGVTMFAESNFAGTSALLTPGEYTSTFFNARQVYSVNSMRIPNGFTVEVWEFYDGASDISDAVYTSDVPQKSSPIVPSNSAPRVIVTGSATPKPSNLNVTEYALVHAGAENVCKIIQDGVETVLTDAQIDGVIADSSRSIITIDPDVDGWSVKNTYADGAARPKVNLYYYGNAVAASVPPPAPNGDGLNANNSFTLSQATGLGLYAVFYQNQGAKEYPFFNAYTAKTTSGTNKSWYKSKVFYGPESNQGDTTADSGNAGLTLIYTGTDDGSFLPNITKRVRYVVKHGEQLTNANDSYASEAVWLLSLQTSGAATSSSESYNFRVLETGVFVSGQKLNLRYNVVSDPVLDPEHPAIKVLPSSTTAPVQATVDTIHEYDLSQDYQKSDILQLLARMKAGVDYTEKRGDAIAEAKESQPTYLSLVNGAKVAYACASRPSVEVVGTRETGSYQNRKVINLKLNANGLEREGIQSVVIILVKEADHTDEDAHAQGAEIVLSFESTNGRLRSYLVEENGATVTTIGSTDNLGPGENHELLTHDVVGFSETALPGTDTFILEMGTLDDNDNSKLYLPVGSEWDSGDVTVVAVVSTRIGTAVDYDTVSDAALD